jgi:hypothetical protein
MSPSEPETVEARCTCPTFDGEQARSFFCPTHGEEARAEQRREYERRVSASGGAE